MNEQREIIKASWLQHVVHKKGGTLHRKKKIVYEDGKWVVLCVHSGRVPLLEWYFSEEYMHGHRPSKVIDLLNPSFVRVVMSDPSRRSFMIGFTDCSRDAVELSALTIEDCDDWIRLTTSVLVRLKCLAETTNLYVSVPNFEVELSRMTEQLIYEGASSDEVPEELAPSLPITAPRNSEYERIFPSLVAQPSGILPVPSTLRAEEKEAKNHRLVETPPPLPPRNTSSLKAQVPTAGEKVQVLQRCSVYDNPKNHASTSFEDSANVAKWLGEYAVNAQSSLYSTLEKSILLDAKITTLARLCAESVRRGYSIPTGTLNVSSAHLHPIAANDSSYPVNFGTSYEATDRISPATIIGAHESHNHSEITNDCGISSGLKNLTVQLFVCMRHIAYVDFDGKVWIAGWTPAAEKCLTGQLFVGDRLVRIADVDVYSTKQIPLIFSSISSKTGLSVNIAIQRVPHGTIYMLEKTKQDFDAGFIFDKRKIRLVGVFEGSPAWKAGIRPLVPAATRTGTAPACITCIDIRSLHVFSKDGEVSSYIDSLPLSLFSVIIQPYDFVKILKRTLKKLKNVGDFVH